MSERFVVPKRSRSARRTSSSSSISSWTIASLEIVAAPWRANAASASLLPAPTPPVIATSRRFVVVFRSCGRFDVLGLGGLVGRRGRALGEDLFREAEVRRRRGGLLL